MLVPALLLGAVILMPSHLSAAEPVLADYDTRTVTVPETGEFRYRLLRPTTLEPGATYPVVLFLHGAGEWGDDNARRPRLLDPGLRQRRRARLAVRPTPSVTDSLGGRRLDA